MSTTSFADLPIEVQEMTGPYLRPHDLAICVRVCHAWKLLFSPALWRHIEAGALRANGDLIHSLHLSMDDTQFMRFLDYSPPTFAQLTSMVFNGFSGADDTIADLIGSTRSTVGWKKVVFEVSDKFTYAAFEPKIDQGYIGTRSHSGGVLPRWCPQTR
ncbi:hypothetical protein BGX33_009511 [Mortierella sp. NVP41]|nr:hypothetical protein BGX33_009511 [Mortierella sp. NVP41]